MGDLPSGTVTFLFIDIEGSTERWERDRHVMAAAVERHIALLDAAIQAHGGTHFKTVGDAVQAAFPTAPQAVAAALDAQRALLREAWEAVGDLPVRMAVHAGGAEPDAGGDYLAPQLNRLSRLPSTGTLHRLFPSRDALIEGLGLLALHRISAAYAARLDEGTAPQALKRLIEALVPIVHQFAYLVGETQLYQNDVMMDGDRALQEETERLLRRGQAEGSLRADLPAVWMAHTLAGLLLAAEEAIRMGDIASRQVSRLILESFLNGASRHGARAMPSSRSGT
jgi:AcrR family transcriptional regulator